MENKIREWLIGAGLRKKAVDSLLEERKKMRTHFQQEEYLEVGVNVGRFCEAVVQILQLKINSELTNESVRDFAKRFRHSGSAEDYSTAINQHIPNMLHTAYDIRSNRDAAHLNLETPINRANAVLGIALCSSMLIELIREFVAEQEVDDIDEIANVINQLSTSVEENPLRSLVISRYEFDRELVLEALKTRVVIEEETNEVKPGHSFSELEVTQQIIALALGRLSAYDLNYIEEVGGSVAWFSVTCTYEGDQVKQELRNYDLMENDSGGYYLPGYNVKEAANRL